MREHVPAEPFYIILNTAVGGDWPGNPNSATRFPQFHDIDYVQVYAIKRATEFGYSLWDMEVYGQEIEFAAPIEQAVDEED